MTNMEKAAHASQEIKVRYALSAFSDLDRAIGNLRRCFGFIHQEYIGYVNTFTKSYRVRPEHYVVMQRLKIWAWTRAVDAIFWIDYAKPTRAHMMGLRDSRPFSAVHMDFDAQPEEQSEEDIFADTQGKDGYLGDGGAEDLGQTVSAGYSYAGYSHSGHSKGFMSPRSQATAPSPRDGSLSLKPPTRTVRQSARAQAQLKPLPAA